MKILKKIFQVLFTLFLIALLVGAGYVMYDYSQNPGDYDDFAKLFHDKATGKDKIVVEEVSPFVTPNMTLTLENSPYEGSYFLHHEDFKPMEPVVLCYGKDMGGTLYIPDFNGDLAPDTVQKAILYGGPGMAERDITQYVTHRAELRRLEVREELMKSLAAGEYYIILDFWDVRNQFVNRTAAAVILEEETTFNSTQRGFLTYGDEFAWIVNDLDDPKEISFTFYNLGDNPIRSLQLVSENAGSYLTTDADPDHYYINERGDTVTLKVEYLQQMQVNTIKKLGVRLANGDVLDMGWTVLGTVRGDSLQRLTIKGPDTYSLSSGGDYVATYEPNQCDRMYALHMDYFSTTDPGVSIFVEYLRGEDIGTYLDMSTKTITIPAEIMQKIPPDDGTVELKIGYFINNVWFDAFHVIKVTQ